MKCRLINSRWTWYWQGLSFLGLHIGDERNQNVSDQEPAAIGGENGKVWIVPTEEER